MKFGGTAINSADKVRHIASLIKSQKEKGNNEIVGVISAARGMTDKISSIPLNIKISNKQFITDFLKNTRYTHINIIDNAIKNERLKNEARSVLSLLIKELEDILTGVLLLGEITPKSLDYLMSFGERLSTPIVSFALRDIGLLSEYLTGKEAGILTDSNFGEARPLMDTTRLRVVHKIEPLLSSNVIPLVTGFIGADQNGNITTIGRGGSDYTATIIASSLDADEVWFLGDVDGLMTADPKIVSEAKVIREVSFAEAMEMALFGAKYMHPRALEPVIDTKIPVRIRNAFKVNHLGTLISQNLTKTSQKTVKSISAIRHTALIDVSGGGMVGAPGTAAKIFDALAKNRVNIMMISQSPSESSISIVVRRDELDKAITTLDLNLLGKVVKRVVINNDVAVIAVVGSGMRGLKGVAARVFNAVAKRNVNVIMIVQGSSELNLAFVVNDSDCEQAVIALHDEFELSKTD
ncbi:MAG TPA: aspartate kinase [Nitrososphaeraceae archaeon]|nr:aspartate kinase [Nitrososphaeraceae archaeon]